MQKIFFIFGILFAILYTAYSTMHLVDTQKIKDTFFRSSPAVVDGVITLEKKNVDAPRVSTPTPQISTKDITTKSAPTVPVSIPKKVVETPGPLVVETPVNASVTPPPPPDTATKVPGGVGALNQTDILLFTNKERVQFGFSPLTWNSRLSAMAEAKARDMIKNQYFEHVSPTGVDITMLAKQYDYAYLNIGENLALGDFVSSQEVVTGWMNSPGHRANILHKSYTELGVAAIVGTYNGRTVWFAVQEFGRPMSDCTIPDVALKQKIASLQEQIQTLETTLANLKSEIDTPGISREVYNAKVNEYNALVALFNDLVISAKKSIAEYNVLTDAYNTCIVAP